MDGDALTFILGEIRQIIRYISVEVQFFFLRQLKHKHGSELLGYRADHVPGIRLIGNLPLPVGKAVGFVVDDPPAVGNEDGSVKNAVFVAHADKRIDFLSFVRNSATAGSCHHKCREK